MKLRWPTLRAGAFSLRHSGSPRGGRWLQLRQKQVSMAKLRSAVRSSVRQVSRPQDGGGNGARLWSDTKHSSCCYGAAMQQQTNANEMSALGSLVAGRLSGRDAIGSEVTNWVESGHWRQARGRWLSTQASRSASAKRRSLTVIPFIPVVFAMNVGWGSVRALVRIVEVERLDLLGVFFESTRAELLHLKRSAVEPVDFREG